MDFVCNLKRVVESGGIAAPTKSTMRHRDLPELRLGAAAWRGAALLALCLFAAGCGAPGEETPPVAAPVELEADELQARLDRALETVLQRRSLSLDQHAAWQILHGALAYGREFPIDGAELGAVDHLLSGGPMRGWDVEPGTPFDNGRTGLRVHMEVGSKAGQGHPDQWFAILAQCGLPPNHPVQAGGREYHLQDLLSQIQYEVPRNLTAEYSWTLIGLTTFLPTTAEWQASDGRTWSVELLMEKELGQELSTSACGGTHRLIGLAMARNRRVADGQPLDGVWEQTQTRLERMASRARELQNPDGSFSTQYFSRPSTSPDLAQNLGATGHVLEYLAVALPHPALDEPWVRRSVAYLCELLEETNSLPLECGALYHAVHGLALYRERVYGKRSYAAGG